MKVTVNMMDNRFSLPLLATCALLLAGCLMMLPEQSSQTSATPPAVLVFDSEPESNLVELSQASDDVQSTDERQVLAAAVAATIEAASQARSLLETADSRPSGEADAANAGVADATGVSAAELPKVDRADIDLHRDRIDALCREIGGKLGSVSVSDCQAQQLLYAGGFSVQDRVLVQKDFLPTQAGAANNRILVMGGIHGDEYSSVSIMFRWMELLSAQADTGFHWRFLPLANPDGLLARNATRQNANGVDLNRNFPSADWEATAIDTWRRRTGSNPRRYPGPAAASEPETRWILQQMEAFDPLVIVSVHAPHDLLDFDGHVEAPTRIGMLQLQQLGVFPGSLGNYGGLNLGIPVITLELPSAGIMPNAREIQNMWADLQEWLSRRAPDLVSARAVAGD